MSCNTSEIGYKKKDYTERNIYKLIRPTSTGLFLTDTRVGGYLISKHGIELCGNDNYKSIDNVNIGLKKPGLAKFNNISLDNIQVNGTLSVEKINGAFIGSDISGYANFLDVSCSSLTIGNMKYPNTDGSNGQILKTDGSGNITWESSIFNLSSLNELSDVLIENSSMYLGHDPVATTSDAINNIAVGMTSLDSITTGDNNTAVGYNALTNLQSGGGNVAIGSKAAYNLTTGGESVFIGYNARPYSSTSSNEIVMGCGTVGCGNNYAIIGNSNITRLYAANDGEAQVYASGLTISSDRRLKKDIVKTRLGLDFINSLNPVSYKFIEDRQGGQTHQGLIAQEVEETMNSFDMLEEDNFLVNYDKNEDKYRMNYNELISPLIKSIQELDTKNEDYKSYNDKMLISLIKDNKNKSVHYNLKFSNLENKLDSINSIDKLEDTSKTEIDVLKCNIKELFNKTKNQEIKFNNIENLNKLKNDKLILLENENNNLKNQLQDLHEKVDLILGRMNKYQIFSGTKKIDRLT